MDKKYLIATWIDSIDSIQLIFKIEPALYRRQDQILLKIADKALDTSS